MPNNLTHFAIHAVNIDRARRFYETVFEWKFQPWGPPDFYQIRTGSDQEPGVQGALQRRRELVAGKPIFGFECTISVEDVDDIALAVEKAGGKILMEKAVIPTVGELIFFQDPEGNVVGAIRFDSAYRPAR
jgi:predicted enzyme related to lactoylglutathione lyase